MRSFCARRDPVGFLQGYLLALGHSFFSFVQELLETYLTIFTVEEFYIFMRFFRVRSFVRLRFKTARSLRLAIIFLGHIWPGT